MIALDANGADRGPATVGEGGRLAGVPVRLYGPAAELAGFDNVIDAPVTIGNDEEPVRAVRSKADASIVRAVKAVAAGEAGAAVSAGSTGAALAASVLHLKRMHGVHRPGIAVLLPIPGAPALMVDVGGNVEVRPEHLVQFAYMGSASWRRSTGSSARAWRCCPSARSPTRARRTWCGDERPSGGALNFIGNVEGSDVTGAARPT